MENTTKKKSFLSNSFYCSDKIPSPKAILGGKGLLHLLTHNPSLGEVEAVPQGRNRNVGTEAETMEKAVYYLAPHNILNLISYST